MIENKGLYSVKNMETGKYIIKDTKYIQIAQEEFLHYWRFKYKNRENRKNLYSDFNKTYGIRF